MDKSVEIQMGVFVDRELLNEFPVAIAEEFRVVPLQRLGKGFLVGAVQPPSPKRLKDLIERIGCPICAIPCHLSDIEQVFSTLYGKTIPSQKLGEILTGSDYISDKELDAALSAQESAPKPLGQILVDLGLISQEELLASLSGQEQQNPSVSPALLIDPKLLDLLPETDARRYKVLPLTIADNECVIASAEPLNDEHLAELKALTRHSIRRVPVRSVELMDAIEKSYNKRRRSRLKELRLGDILTGEGLITDEQLEIALEEQKTSKKKLGEVLIQKGFIGEEALYSALGAQLGCEYRRFVPSEIDLEMSRFISKRFAKQNQALMIAGDETKHQITVAMADPADLNLRDILQGLVSQHGYTIQPVLASPSSIEAGIAYTYQSRGLLSTDEDVETVYPDTGEELSFSDNLPEVRRMVNQLLFTAVTEGVSDIHIENLETTVQVRLRTDGVLEDRLTPITKGNIASVISLLKVDSGLDIAERRRSQDGVFKKRIGKDRFIDFRINVHATPFGEDAVIRILDREKNLLPLEKLGFEQDIFSNYQRLVENPQGLILFTGPTGSGKTTTLYSTLTHLNEGDRKIVTAEDPIEYVLKGISQYQVNEAIGNTFDDYARRFLRKDPDIILIGEIRDNKTAKACVSAAMTGHLVFSTLHTNDSIGVIQRMLNLDVPPSSVADSILLVVSQRLARRICVQCKQTYEPSQKLLSDFFPHGIPEGLIFARGAGCEACRGKGYRGRVGLYEFWEVKPNTRHYIGINASEEEIRKAALKEGMQLLISDALIKIKKQVTTLEELSRVVSIDQRQRYLELPEHQRST
jgi:type IV pilus assembly protein PilB